MNRLLLGMLKRKNPINPNLLIPNQATCGAATGDTVGFEDADTSTVEYDAISKRIKCTTNNSIPLEGMYWQATGLIVDEEYTSKIVATIPLGVELYCYFGTVNNGTIVGEGEEKEYTFTNTATGTYSNIGLWTKNKELVEFYTNKLVVRKGGY